jgi:hypothetical protein
MSTQTKPTHAKPSLYAYYFERLKDIARGYGYNLVLHGSLNRDLDLVAIPWQLDVKDHDEMIQEFCKVIGGRQMLQDDDSRYCFPHGRMSYVINLNRGEYTHAETFHDPQYYIDISVIPTPDQHDKRAEKMATLLYKNKVESILSKILDPDVNRDAICDEIKHFQSKVILH